MRKYITKENLLVIVLSIIALHPLIELDYLFTDFIDSIGLVRITTIIDFIILPLIVLITFFLYEKRKKRILIFSISYALIFGLYFILHIISANNLQYKINLTDNFYFSLYYEIIYTITLLLPLVYIWVIYKYEISENLFKKVSLTIGTTYALTIFISNILMVGYSTYTTGINGNIFSWFNLPYDELSNHPRFYATKFFYEEGNTTGILMIINSPFLYYFFLKEKDRLKKILEGLLIVVHSLSMIILSTRIATYGAILVPLMVLIVYIILWILKYEKFKSYYVSFILAISSMCLLIIPYSPAYQNQQLDSRNFAFQAADDEKKDEVKDGVLLGGDNLEPFSTEWINYYVNAFEEYSFMIGVTPPIYYTEFYSYKADPKFWVDFIFNYELEERINGRQLETIFTKYKWDYLENNEKLLGLGYSTFMNGSILIERDFVQQYYSYGPIGFILIMSPWLIIWLYLAIKLILGYKDKKWNMLNILLMAGFSIGLLASYVSGHTLDELTTSLFIALCAGYLFKRLKNEA